jgi:hypothetical protein
VPGVLVPEPAPPPVDWEARFKRQTEHLMVPTVEMLRERAFGPGPWEDRMPWE